MNSGEPRKIKMNHSAGLRIQGLRDALPREIGTAVEMAEFHEQVNDALG